MAGRLVSSLDALGRKRQWGSINVDSRTLDRTRRAIGDFVVENLNRTVENSAASMAAVTANPAAATDAQAAEAEERAGALRQFRDLARTLKIDYHTKARFETITRSMDQEAIEQVRSAVRQGLPKAEIDQIIVDRLRLCDIVEGYERAKELRSKLTSAVTAGSDRCPDRLRSCARAPSAADRSDTGRAARSGRRPDCGNSSSAGRAAS